MLKFRGIGTLGALVVLAVACGSSGRNTAFEGNASDGGTSNIGNGNGGNGVGAPVGNCTDGKVCVGKSFTRHADALLGDINAVSIWGIYVG